MFLEQESLCYMGVSINWNVETGHQVDGMLEWNCVKETWASFLLMIGAGCEISTMRGITKVRDLGGLAFIFNKVT